MLDLLKTKYDFVEDDEVPAAGYEDEDGEGGSEDEADEAEDEDEGSDQGGCAGGLANVGWEVCRRRRLAALRCCSLCRERTAVRSGGRLAAHRPASRSRVLYTTTLVAVPSRACGIPPLAALCRCLFSLLA